MGIYEFRSPSASSVGATPSSTPSSTPSTPSSTSSSSSTPEATPTGRATEDPELAFGGASPAEAPASGPFQREIGKRVQLGSVASDREILLQGQRAFERGEDATALESLERLRTHGTRFADVHYMLGMLHERSGNLEAALVSLREAIRINPSYVEALLALASLHERRGEYDRSQGYAERASQLSRPTGGGLDPTTRGKLANQQAALADALAQAGERRDAIEQYRRALDRCPTFHDVRHRLGVVLREAGLPAQAAAEFARILRTHPGMLESQIQLGLTYYSMGRTPEAVREWDAVLEKDPSRDEARMYLRLIGATNRPAAQSRPEDDEKWLEAGAEPSLEAPAVEAPAQASSASFAETAAETSAGTKQQHSSGWSRTALVGRERGAAED